MPRARISTPRELEKSVSETRVGYTARRSTYVEEKGETRTYVAEVSKDSLEHAGLSAVRHSKGKGKEKCDAKIPHCRTVKKKVPVPSPCVKPFHERAAYKLPCPTVACDDVKKRVRVPAQLVGAKDVKLKIVPDKVKIGPDTVDLKLDYDKFSCESPQVEVDVDVCSPVIEQQNIHIEVVEQECCKEAPILRIHGPGPLCANLKPRVNVNVHESAPVCVPTPNITVSYKRDGCDKPVVYKQVEAN